MTTNFKITNKQTKVVQFMNAKEVANFVFKNDHTKYNIQSLDKKRLLDYLHTWLLIAGTVTAFIGSFLLYIQLNY